MILIIDDWRVSNGLINCTSVQNVRFVVGRDGSAA